MVFSGELFKDGFNFIFKIVEAPLSPGLCGFQNQVHGGSNPHGPSTLSAASDRATVLGPFPADTGLIKGQLAGLEVFCFPETLHRGEGISGDV